MNLPYHPVRRSHQVVHITASDKDGDVNVDGSDETADSSSGAGSGTENVSSDTTHSVTKSASQDSTSSKVPCQYCDVLLEKADLGKHETRHLIGSTYLHN